jgi:protocatechuate 3,4-dioxygenase beta subunit
MDVASRFPYLSRRGFLIAGGMAFSGIRAFPATPACALSGEMEEGPYYVDDETLRRDITEGRPGVPLRLAIRLVDSRSCAPLPDAALDIWHSDALGVYSGFTASNPDGPGMPPPGFGPGGPRPRQIDSTRFLRGVQITDASGAVEFATLYPGWYFGRAIHVHMKVHLGGLAEKKYSGGHVAHTGQLFFPEDVTERVAKIQPYATRLSVHRTSQAEDGIFKSQHGAASMAEMERLGKTDADGFRAVITVAVDPEATPAPVRGFGGPGRGPRPGA